MWGSVVTTTGVPVTVRGRFVVLVSAGSSGRGGGGGGFTRTRSERLGGGELPRVLKRLRALGRAGSARGGPEPTN